MYISRGLTKNIHIATGNLYNLSVKKHSEMLNQITINTISQIPKLVNLKDIKKRW